METIKEVLTKYLFFVVIFAVFLVILVMFILFTSKNKKRYNLAGLLLTYTNLQILALSLQIMNYLLLTYVLIFKIKIDLAIIIVSMMLILFGYLISGNFKYMFINGFINGINLSLIYLAGLVNTLRVETNDVTYYILQILMNVFGLLFFLFTLLKFIKNNKPNKEKINEKVN